MQELQISPMGVVQLIYPLTQTTASGHGIDIFAQVCIVQHSVGADGVTASCFLLLFSVYMRDACGTV